MADERGGSYRHAQPASQGAVNYIGHVQLKVRDLERAERFYTDLLGFRVTERVGEYAFLSLGESHHDLALHEVGAEADTPPEDGTGLEHFAIQVQDRAALARFYSSLIAAGTEVEGFDHGISLSLYFDDPDGNRIELYVDTRHVRQEWRGISEPLDLDDLEGSGIG